jgi:LacI family transcriptional regulator
MGKAAARCLLALIAGDEPSDVRLSARLVERGSCGEAGRG